MSVDISAKGRRYPRRTVAIERDRVRFFAATIGEDNPLHHDVVAARSAGLPDLLVPPTMLFGLEMPLTEPFAWMEEIGIDMRYLLHAEQRFDYRQPLYAGDEVTFAPRIEDVFSKKGGALDFVIRVCDVTRDGELAVVMKQTVVVRYPARESS